MEMLWMSVVSVDVGNPFTVIYALVTFLTGTESWS